MPRLPLLEPGGDVPSSSGIPLRTQRAPFVGTPEASQKVGALLGRSVQRLGGDVLEATSIGLHTQDLRARTQRAQDVLDAKTRLQDYVLGLDQEYDTLVQGDYRTLPETVVERGRALVGAMSEGMRPQAAALFREDAMQRLAVMQQKALGERTQRREAETLFTQSRAKEQARLDFERAASAAEQMDAMTRYEQLNLDMVQAGLIRGDAAAKDVAEMRQLALETGAVRWLSAFPDQAMEHFGRLLRGEPGLEGAPPVPPGKEKAYFDLAQQEFREQLTISESVKQAAERDLDKAQERTEVDLTNQVISTNSVQGLLGLQRAVQQVATDQTGSGVSPAGQRRLFSLIQARIDDLKKPKESSDQSTLIRLGVATLAQRGQRTLQDTQTLMGQVSTAIEKGFLRWQDGKPLLSALQEEMQEDSPMRLRDVAREQSVLAEELEATSKFDFSDEAQKRKIFAHREYERQIREIAQTQGADAASLAAPGIRREVADAFAVTTIREVQKQLNIAPRGLPAGILDESALPANWQELEQRYQAGKAEIMRRYDGGAVQKDQAVSLLHTLDQRKAWIEYQMQQQPPPVTQKAQEPGFLEKLKARFFGTGESSAPAEPPTAPAQPQQPQPAAPSGGGFQRR